jgi:hypothetical protein
MIVQQFILIALFLGFYYDVNGAEQPPTPAPASRIPICSIHPNIDTLLKYKGAGYTLPTTHPTVQPLFNPFLPRGGTILFVKIIYFSHYM